MGTTNWGSQDIQWNYFDPLNSDEFDKHSQDIIAVGIYKGGELEIINDTTIRVKPLVCMISDGVQQSRIKTAANADIAIAPGTPYVILRWVWQPLTNWYMDIMSVAVGSIVSTDIIVGKGVYAGSTLVSIDYGSATALPRTVPTDMSQFLKVAPTPTASMYVFVSNGWVSYGPSRLYVAAQTSPLFVAPGSLARKDILWVDSAGNLQITQGTPGASPAAPDHTGKIVLAEITLLSTSTIITADMITDARPWINLAGAAGLTGVVSAFLLMGA